MDLNSLSDEELIKLHSQKKGKTVASNNYAQMSDDELIKLHNAKKAKTSSKESKPIETSLGEKLETGLESFGNAVSFGYLPQAQAGAGALIDKLMGEDVSKESYVKERDENIRRQKFQEERNPKSALAGTIGGALTGGIAMPGPGLAGGLGKAALKAGTYGAGLGLVANPGDKEGEIDLIQGPERLEQAKTGALIGAGGSAGAKGLQSLAGSVGRLPETLKEFSSGQTIKAAGGMLRDFRNLADRKLIKPLGEFAQKNGLVKAGDSYDDIAQKAESLRERSGQRLDEIYQKARGASGDTINGFNPVKDEKEAIEIVADRLGDKTDKAAAIHAVKKYFRDLKSKYGDNLLDPKKANEIKSAVDESIDYARNPLTKQPGHEQAWTALRDYINKKVISQVDEVAGRFEDKSLGKALKEENKAYGFSKKVRDMAQDRANRESSNIMISLTDTIAGGAGGVVGGAAGGMLGDSARSTAEGAVVGSLLSAGVNKLGRKYGPGLMASGSRALSYPAQVTAPLGKLSEKIPPEVLLKSLLTAKLSEKDK